MNRKISQRFSAASSSGGFTMLEIMVALTLGLLLSVGILSLFTGTSRTNKLQSGLARLQENGRFAAGRMETDLRMTGAQYCSNFAGPGTSGTVVPVIPRRAPMVLAANLGIPDPSPDTGGAGLGVMNSLDGGGYPSASANAGAGYILSPRFFVQGYACASAGSCTPSGLPTGLPAEGTDPGDRLPGSDVLTIRYQRGTGWPVNSTSAACASGGTMTLTPATGDDSPVNLAVGDTALVTDCINASIVPVASYGGNTLTLGTLNTGSAICANPGDRDMRVFNFSKDFVTVTYYVRLAADLSPDARSNSPTSAQRVVPVLVRRENGANEQELVQGIDQLAFRYGIQDASGRTRFMTAGDIDSSTDCPPAPDGVINEPGCLWRAVRIVEAHLLVNTVDEVFGLDDSSRQYQFVDGVIHTATDATVLPSGLKSGSMLRREFIAYVSNRNYNF